jgi:hypothetical protein
MDSETMDWIWEQVYFEAMKEDEEMEDWVCDECGGTNSHRGQCSERSERVETF